MVDNMSGEPPIEATPEPKTKSAFATFATSPTGKLVGGGIVLFIVIGAVAALAFFFLVNSGNQPDIAVVVPKPAKPATETVVPTNPPEQPLDETFTFRNVFAPTVQPAPDPTTTTTSNTTTATTTGTGSTGNSSSSSTNAPKDTLVLKSIHVESGEYVATFEWNGAEYEAREGDQVSDSPWKVVSIDSDSVVMLYGDSQVTLTVGQGYSDGGADSK